MFMRSTILWSICFLASVIPSPDAIPFKPNWGSKFEVCAGNYAVDSEPIFQACRDWHTKWSWYMQLNIPIPVYSVMVPNDLNCPFRVTSCTMDNGGVMPVPYRTGVCSSLTSPHLVHQTSATNGEKLTQMEHDIRLFSETSATFGWVWH